MSSALGYKGRLILDYETAFATEPGTPAGLVLPVKSFNLKSNRPKNSSQVITGTRNPVAPFDGNLVDSGTSEVPVDALAFGYWLKAMFGAPTTSPVDTFYSHVFEVGDSQMSCVMETRYSSKSGVVTYAKHNGAKVSTFTIDVGGDDELLATMGLEAATETLSATPYDASPTTVSLAQRFDNYQAAIVEGGSTLANATAMNFNVNFGLDTEIYLVGSGGVRGDLPEGILEVTGNVTTLFENTTLLDKAIASTESSIVLTFTSGLYSLSLAFNELQFERNTPGIEGPRGILLDLPFVAYMDDDAAASVIVATLVNNVASYA